MKVYFDNAASTPLDPKVIDYMTDILRNEYGNPSSIHTEGRKTKNTIEQARKRIASQIGASPSEIVFMSGGTEANNTALKCAVKDMGITRIISMPIEHHCVLNTLDKLQQDGVEICYLTVSQDGEIDLAVLEDLLSSDDQKTMVSIMYANNEIGSVFPLKEIAELTQNYNALCHSDTVQAVGHFEINTATWPVHFMSGSAHKFHGPKGVGFLYMNSNVSINPLIHGGSQERKLRAGTENISGIAGMAIALEMACEEMDSRRNHILSLRNTMKNALLTRFDGVQINGPKDDSGLYTVLSVSFPPTNTSSLLLMQLDMKGICVSTGSACGSGTSQPSHVIQTVREDDGFVTIRFSFSHYNTHEELDYTLEQLQILMPQHTNI